MMQYRRVFDHALKVKADIVIFGGDITPKTPIGRRTPKGQKDFLKEELFPALKEFNDNSQADVLMIMGNDDFKSNHGLLVENQEYYGYRMIDETPYVTKTGYSIIGCSYIPSTPFRYKCWERRDLESDEDFSDRDDTRLEGVISRQEELIPHSLENTLTDPSIEQEIEAMAVGIDPDKLILVTHAPPFKTVCDYNREHKHVGSRAVKAFIENKQPFLTLHGHIHETVDLTGQFKEQIGKSICATAGNDNRPDEPYVLEFELKNMPDLKRLKI